MTAKLVTLPSRDIQSVPECLRNLANSIEAGEYADALSLVWVMDCGDSRIEVGLMGRSIQPGTEAYYLLGLGQRQLEKI